MNKYKRIKLFNKVPFDIILKKELIKELTVSAVRKEKKMVLNMNAYGVVTFLENKKYAKVMNSADIIYPDGWGPVLASKYMKSSLSERVNVGDFIDELLFNVNNNQLRLFLLGSEESLVKKTAQAIKRKYKNIIVCGFHNGFIRFDEVPGVCRLIRNSKPNLVLVGMGVPLQEYFISDNWSGLPNAIYMGIGGAFNYITKTKTRAPVWMRNHSLEWLYRLLQEPRRLWRRYTLINAKFVIYLIKFLFRRKT